MQYARKVDFNLKTGQEKEFNRIFESKIVPILQKQKGFQDEIVVAAGRQVTAISLWDTRQSAESYEKTSYPKVIETLKPVIEANPKVQLCDAVYSMHHSAAI